MSVDTFTPEIWSKKLLSSLKKALVIAAPGVVNRDYEGEIADAGDTVHINSIGRPTIATYVKGVTNIVPEPLTAAQRSLVIDQSKYFAFEVDDVDRRQNAGDVIPEGMQEAAYALRDVADMFVESLMRAGAATKIDADGIIPIPTATPTAAYDNVLVPLKVALDELNVPMEGRFCLIPPWVHGRLLRDDRFVRADASGTTTGLRNGIAGDAAGFSIRVSNNLPLLSGTHGTNGNNPVVAGHPMATSYAEQINKTEAYRPESSFSDAVKGLHLYGAKVTRPEALVWTEASED